MTSRPRKRSLFSAEDLKLWHSIARSATPLFGRSPVSDDDLSALLSEEDVSRETSLPAESVSGSTPDAGRVPVLFPDSFEIGSQGRGVSPAAPKNPRTLPSLSKGQSPGVDRRTAQRFKRGRMDIDGRIDLHGMGQEVAHAALIRFITGSAQNGLRCVLVITGQGDRGQGVLKKMVPRWLNDTPLRPHVLSFSQAQVDHGGYGALYVLLRRKRPL